MNLRCVNSSSWQQWSEVLDMDKEKTLLCLRPNEHMCKCVCVWLSYLWKFFVILQKVSPPGNQLRHFKVSDISRKVHVNNFLHSQCTLWHAKSLKSLITICQMKLLSKDLIWFKYIDLKFLIDSTISGVGSSLG